MMDEKNRPTTQLIEKKIRNFLEELTWVISSNSSIDFKNLPKHLSNLLTKRADTELESCVSENPNIHFLTGVLPRIFINETLFSSNEEIAEFSSTALCVQIPRWSKLNKFEIIGHIVCQVQNLDDFQLKKLVLALEKVLKGDNRARNLIEKKTDGKRDWNLIIQELTKDG
jgi:hypothetical protein